MVSQQLDTRSEIRASADLLQPRAACSRPVLTAVPVPLPVVARPSAHPRKQLLFVLLSLADLLLTWWLLDHSRGQVYERNPIALWWLTHHGWLGMIAFKASVVLLVLGLAAIISRSRPRSGGFVLRFACSALLLVVFYSASLCQTVSRNPVARSAAAARTIEEKMQQARAYRATLTALCEELIAGRCTLRQAAQRLGRTPQGNDPAWRRTLATVNPGRSFQECLAGDIICFAVSSRTNAEAAQLLARFEKDYEFTYGRPILRYRIAHLMGTGTACDRTDSTPGTTDENRPEVSAAL